MRQLFSTAPKPDAGAFPCSCAEKGGGCLMRRYGKDQMWEEYHCVLAVVGVVYRRGADGKIETPSGDPTRAPIRKRPIP